MMLGDSWAMVGQEFFGHRGAYLREAVDKQELTCKTKVMERNKSNHEQIRRSPAILQVVTLSSNVSRSGILYIWSLGPSIPGPGPPALPICRAFSSSSQRRRLEAMPELDAIMFLKTRKESYTPVSSGSIGSPVSRSRPTTSPSLTPSRRAATALYVSIIASP